MQFEDDFRDPFQLNSVTFKDESLFQQGALKNDK